MKKYRAGAWSPDLEMRIEGIPIKNADADNERLGKLLPTVRREVSN